MLKSRIKSRDNKKTGALRAFFLSMHGSRAIIAFAIFLVLIGTILSYITPQIIRISIDILIGKEEADNLDTALMNLFGGEDYLRQNMIIVGAVIVVLALIMGILTFFRRYLQLQSSNRISVKLKNDIFVHIQSLPFSYHSTMQTGDIIQRATQDSDLIGRYIARQFFDLFRILFFLVFGVTVMLIMNITLSIVALSFIPLIGITSAIIFPRIASNFKFADEAEGAMTAKLQENLTGIRVVRAFGTQAREVEEFAKKNSHYVSIWVRLGKMLSIFWSSGDFLAGLQTLSVLIAGAYLTANGSITIGTLLAFLLYSQMLVWPVRNIGRVLAETGKVKAGLNRLFEVFDVQSEDYNLNGLTKPIKGSITFENVSFGFNENVNVLDGINFEIKAGTSLGILGATGSGKSTLGHLINRLYDPNKGVIRIDGIDIKEYNLSYLRKNVGLILQEPYLFSKSVRDNINLMYEHDAHEIREYASIANVHHATEHFDKGYDTVVGEKGVVLSGGQKQRLAITRTLINKPPIIIFDDSLSAVDTETDFKIRTALREKLKDTTTVFISHRLTTLMTADNIIVLENGRIADMGTHEELLLREGSYKRIYELQNSIE